MPSLRHSFSEEPQKAFPVKLVAAGVAALVLLGIVLTFIANTFVQVESGTKGLVFTWGKLQDKPLEPGLHFMNPFTNRVEEVTLQPLAIAVNIPVNAAGAITKDNQTIGAETTLYYRNDPERLVEMRSAWSAQKLSAQLQSSVFESFKEVIGAYTIFDLAQNQEKIRGQVWEKIQSKAKEEDYPILLTEYRVQNYDWSDAFDAQINATMQAAQQVKKAEQELLLTEQEAQKKVKLAEAEKQALITKAEGERDAAKLNADARALKGDGERRYNEALRATLDVELRIRQLQIEQTIAERWNGQRVPEQYFTPLPYTKFEAAH